MIDPEEYEGWCSHPVTQAVFAVLKQKAEDRKELWMLKSWVGGECDERALAMLKGQAEAFAFLPDATCEQVFGESE